jgi:hypothetical protein
MGDEVLEKKTVSDNKDSETEKFHHDHAVNFLLRSRYSGIFYKNGTTSYLIPIQDNLGYRVASLKVN